MTSRMNSRSGRRHRGQVAAEFAIVLAVVGAFIASVTGAAMALVRQHALSQGVAALGTQLVTTGSSDDTVLIDTARGQGLVIDPSRDGLRITVTDAAGYSDEYTWGATNYAANYGDLVTVESWLADADPSSAGMHWPLSPHATWSGIADRNSLGATNPAYAKPRAEGGLNGVVSDSATGLPVASAVITLSPGAQSTSSGGDGSFSLPAVPAGSYNALVSAPGYEPYTTPVTIYDGDTTAVLVALAPENS